MLVWKTWLDTRWQFLAGLVLLLFSAAATVFAYPKVLALLADLPPTPDFREAMEVARTYRRYIGAEWFGENLRQLATLFAILLGAAGPVSLYTLSLPVSRTRLVNVRAAAGLVELLVLTLASSILVPLLSPSIGQRYAVAETLLHAGGTFIAASVFFALALFLSTVFNDAWRPVLIALCIAFVLSIARLRLPWVASAPIAVALHLAAIASLKQRDF